MSELRPTRLPWQMGIIWQAGRNSMGPSRSTSKRAGRSRRFFQLIYIVQTFEISFTIKLTESTMNEKLYNIKYDNLNENKTKIGKIKPKIKL